MVKKYSKKCIGCGRLFQTKYKSYKRCSRCHSSYVYNTNMNVKQFKVKHKRSDMKRASKVTGVPYRDWKKKKNW